MYSCLNCRSLFLIPFQGSEKSRDFAQSAHMCFLCLFPGQKVDGGGADKEPVDKVSAARLGCHRQIGFTGNETFPILFSVHF